MGTCKIICSLDGRESAYELYGGYADLSKRTFPNDRHARQVEDYLNSRARGRRGDSKKPAYHIVPVNE
jgi:hypothetical protein